MSIDTSDEACAVACLLVSNPQDSLRKEGDGWQRRVNDLIRALRDERNALRRHPQQPQGGVGVLQIDGKEVTLAECPVGLFIHGDELCLKTEYGNNDGRIDAYIVSSGEFFWGTQPQTIASQRAQKVVPVALASQEGGGGSERLREALLSSPCSHPVAEAGDDHSVRKCIELGACGCDNKAALASLPSPGAQPLGMRVREQQITWLKSSLVTILTLCNSERPPSYASLAEIVRRALEKQFAALTPLPAAGLSEKLRAIATDPDVEDRDYSETLIQAANVLDRLTADQGRVGETTTDTDS